jgi:hypothetical protein
VRCLPGLLLSSGWIAGRGHATLPSTLVGAGYPRCATDRRTPAPSAAEVTPLPTREFASPPVGSRCRLDAREQSAAHVVALPRNAGPIRRPTRLDRRVQVLAQPQSSIPISRRRPPLPRRTRIEPRRRSRSASRSASASSMRRPARHNTTISPRSRRPCRPAPAMRMTATISSSSPATVDGRPHQERRIRTWALPGDTAVSRAGVRRPRASGTIRRTPAWATERKRRAPPQQSWPCSVAWEGAVAAALLLCHRCRSEKGVDDPWRPAGCVARAQPGEVLGGRGSPGRTSPHS